MRGYVFAAAATVAATIAMPASAATLWSWDFDAPAPTTAPGVTGAITADGGGSFAVGGSGGGVSGVYFLNDSLKDPATNLAGLTEVSFSGLSGYTNLNLNATLGFIDSWDGSTGSPAPDYLYIYVNGLEVLRLTSNNQSGSDSFYGGGTVTATGQNLFYNYFNDRIVNMANASALHNLSAPGGTLTVGIRAGGAGWQGGNDESWLIDNISLTGTVAPVPEPATWAMMIAGFGVVGGALRRRRAAATATA